MENISSLKVKIGSKLNKELITYEEKLKYFINLK